MNHHAKRLLAAVLCTCAILSAPKAAAVEIDPAVQAEFDRLIAGDYREQYEAKTRPLQESADKYAALAPVLAELEKRFGLSSGDTAGLQEALAREARDRETEKASRELRSINAYAFVMN